MNFHMEVVWGHSNNAIKSYANFREDISVGCEQKTEIVPVKAKTIHPASGSIGLVPYVKFHPKIGPTRQI